MVVSAAGWEGEWRKGEHETVEVDESVAVWNIEGRVVVACVEVKRCWFISRFG